MSEGASATPSDASHRSSSARTMPALKLGGRGGNSATVLRHGDLHTEATEGTEKTA
jgi:hypothetical protein